MTKKYICIQVTHHNEIAETIDEYQKQGWHLHTYQASGTVTMLSSTNHYLLFEKDDGVLTGNN